MLDGPIPWDLQSMKKTSCSGNHWQTLRRGLGRCSLCHLLQYSWLCVVLGWKTMLWFEVYGWYEIYYLWSSFVCTTERESTKTNSSDSLLCLTAAKAQSGPHLIVFCKSCWVAFRAGNPQRKARREFSISKCLRQSLPFQRVLWARSFSSIVRIHI